MQKFRKLPWRQFLKGIGVLSLILVSNLFFQLTQNDFSFDLAFKFAFSWHTEKFFLGCFVLLIFYGWLSSFLGSLKAGSIFYTLAVIGVGIANYLKMKYRMEPIYPDDLKMITEFGMIRDMVGVPIFLLFLLLLTAGVVLVIFSIKKSLKLKKKKQWIRLGFFLLTSMLLLYIGGFNQQGNLLRKAYNKTALWIPYSQKMNYYNTGFMGGFLYNLPVDAMEKPENYSEAAVKKVTKTYEAKQNEEDTEKPNIVYVMSESFSDPARLKGLEVYGGDPLQDYRAIADKTYSGQMLSQNYGGGTANIEFEALTGFSMELFNAQMTTPYTMLVPEFQTFPSLVSTLKKRGYETTAIHPYNTSMYKRKDVYQTFGFDQFLDESTMKHTDKIENNPYISDEAAYQEIFDQLEKKNKPQFLHLVTMQTHMPYENKYDELPYVVQGDNSLAVRSYLQDIAYSSEALKAFLERLDELPERTLVVFWGDHLPGIYSDAVQEENQGHLLHETEFLMYDNRHQLNNQQVTTSPFYFSADLFQQGRIQMTGFQTLLVSLQKELPAFEKGMYYQSGQWFKEARLNKKQEKLYQDYQMIQYDITAGKQYSLKQNFFE
ncbi:LTA synthase family protein [Enterococcus raffinosus]|uniref:LTA synthase family protein n=1 Tax=Enterococcus raffinosus TaxID=71452 RepID=A0AAW8T7A2_9ENTE|nr:LTA synthase family protein [Enterococcus raffinosus]MDT2524650.1 LTA synthase family protein [Enterococcus raffinosus]MDT2528793.1 LTA synthase family protein [Enterococcus raffinosus]MDT2535367.1 LTA synthase family protein [Enterococcus raffinosus]MDT2542803.1 LTA synthase family protein [Enterococcus raffinosus]MDT2553502.1 LTA synthase family protein [Enterococcus raffinosus]